MDYISIIGDITSVLSIVIGIVGCIYEDEICFFIINSLNEIYNDETH